LNAIATSGDYNDLTNTPTLFSGNYNDLTNQPSLFDGAYSSLSGQPTLGTLAALNNVNYTTDITNTPTLGTLASQNTVNYSTDITNTPTLGTLASQDTVNYSTQVTSKPTIPSSTSDLTNDSDFQTGSQVSSAISSAGYATESYVTTQVGTKSKIYYSSSAPSGANTGDLWYNTSTGTFKRWSGSSWVDVSITADSIAANYVYAGTINAVQINSGEINVARLPGIGVAGSTSVSSSLSSASFPYTMTVSFSGVTSGSSMMAVLNGTFDTTNDNGSVSITPTGSNVSLNHNQSIGGFAYNRTTYANCISATATSTSGSLGFSIGRSPSGGVYVQAAVSLLTFKA